jgi:hypothetical protein
MKGPAWKGGRKWIIIYSERLILMAERERGIHISALEMMREKLHA